MKSPPMTVPEIVTWIKENPGKFTYAQPMQSDFSSYDFTGSVFIRQLFYYYCGPYTDFIGDYDETKYLQRASALFTVLREIEPYLYKANDAVYHPTNHTDVERLFAEGKIDFVSNYQSNDIYIVLFYHSGITNHDITCLTFVSLTHSLFADAIL